MNSSSSSWPINSSRRRPIRRQQRQGMPTRRPRRMLTRRLRLRALRLFPFPRPWPAAGSRLPPGTRAMVSISKIRRPAFPIRISRARAMCLQPSPEAAGHLLILTLKIAHRMPAHDPASIRHRPPANMTRWQSIRPWVRFLRVLASIPARRDSLRSPASRGSVRSQVSRGWARFPERRVLAPRSPERRHPVRCRGLIPLAPFRVLRRWLPVSFLFPLIPGIIF